MVSADKEQLVCRLPFLKTKIAPISQGLTPSALISRRGLFHLLGHSRSPRGRHCCYVYLQMRKLKLKEAN